MNIAIDARVIEKQITGIGRYLQGFLDWLTKIDKKNTYFLFCYEGLKKYEKDGYKVINTGKSKFLPVKIYNLFWLNCVLPKVLNQYKIDLFWNPNHYLPLKKINTKKVITIHDMAHKVDKNYKSFLYKFFYLDFLLPRSYQGADIILTISENSKKDIEKYYKTHSQKIKIVYPAANSYFKSQKIEESKIIEIQKKYNLPKDFILYVGKIETRKNIAGIIKIADIIASKEEFAKISKYKIALVGGVGYSGSKKLIEEIGKRKNICHIPYVSEKDLPLIYNLAKIFLFPSFYEGFGLPVLEAMQSGIPVLTSNTSSLPEIVGEEGIMHNPNDYMAFAKDIKNLIENENFYKIMQKRAQEQAKKFSWEKSTTKLIQIFNNLS